MLYQLVAAPAWALDSSSANKDGSPADATVQRYLDAVHAACYASHPHIEKRVSKNPCLPLRHERASQIAGAWPPVA